MLSRRILPLVSCSCRAGVFWLSTGAAASGGKDKQMSEVCMAFCLKLQPKGVMYGQEKVIK